MLMVVNAVVSDADGRNPAVSDADVRNPAGSDADGRKCCWF